MKPDPLYVGARRVLLDALVTLRPHLDSIVLVGAQAVYLHTGKTELAVAPFTLDADVVIDPTNLATAPDLSQTMLDANFSPGPTGNPGHWIGSTRVQNRVVDIEVDLMVPEQMSNNPGHRSARLSGHHRNSARSVRGLEATVIDNEWLLVEALEETDDRSVWCRVAGPSALLVAKAHKIQDRLEPGTRLDRQKDKDALDMYRIALAVPESRLVPSFLALVNDNRSATATQDGLRVISRLFSSPRSVGVQMTSRALGGSVPANRITAVLTNLGRLSSRLLGQLD